jgi:hypothetical protein
MSWLRIDDGYDTHPKLLELTEQQRWRWTRVLIHCARHQTQGHVKPAVLRELGLGRTVAKLLQLGLLETNGDAGYLVHDWSTFNPKDPTKAERQARWRASRATSTEPSTPPSTSASTNDELVDAEIVHSRVGARARPVPSPTHVDQEPSFLPAELQDEEGGRTENSGTDFDLPDLGSILHEMPT